MNQLSQKEAEIYLKWEMVRIQVDLDEYNRNLEDIEKYEEKIERLDQEIEHILLFIENF
jgi:hypothetical protein